MTLNENIVENPDKKKIIYANFNGFMYFSIFGFKLTNKNYQTFIPKGIFELYVNF